MPLYKFPVRYRETPRCRREFGPGTDRHSTLSLYPPVSCLHQASPIGLNILLRLLIQEKTLFFYILQHSDPFMPSIKSSEFSTISAARKVLKRGVAFENTCWHFTSTHAKLSYTTIKQKVQKNLLILFFSVQKEKRVYSLRSSSVAIVVSDVGVSAHVAEESDQLRCTIIDFKLSSVRFHLLYYFRLLTSTKRNILKGIPIWINITLIHDRKNSSSHAEETVRALCFQCLAVSSCVYRSTEFVPGSYAINPAGEI